MEFMLGLIAVICILLLIIFLQARIQKKWKKTLVDFNKKEQHYLSLYQQNPGLIMTFDLEGNFLSANKTIELYGYTEEEVLHRSFAPYITPTQREKALAYFETTKKGKSTAYETAIYSKDGEIVEVKVTNIPIIVGNQTVGVHAVLKDMTVLNKTQAALIETEAHYRRLTEESVVGIYIIQDEIIRYVNPKITEMLGYTREELVGAHVINFIHPEDRLAVRYNLKKRLEEGFTDYPSGKVCKQKALEFDPELRLSTKSTVFVAFGV
ncbi:PAS domain S-box protein [Domibacillus sp. PGB-M46]|uniref:PAS domain-containing protein n=1 Tax=Domibacillus sp. PGB-M46 TaxID=2910255 RepID=UPI001F58977F|nr:PAS domain S-box protein [Domibacillus sp. PGB-M46]MCI2256220.1 PAS domain S-box protein [Domibacillus sp. PGB-M46]